MINYANIVLNLKHSSIVVLLISLFLFTLSVDDVQAQEQVLLVANQFSGTLTAIDIATDKVVDTIELLPQTGARGLCSNSDGSRVYVFNNGSGTVSVIDVGMINNGVDGDEVIETISVGSSPWACDITPDDSRLYVVNMSSNTVSVIDLANYSVITISDPSISSPRGVRISPDGLRAVVSNASSDRLTVISTVTNTVIATPSVIISSGQLDFTPDGVKAYLGHTGGLPIEVLDGTTLTQLKTILITDFGVTVHDVVVSPDGSKVYGVIQGSQGTLMEINTTTDVITRSLTFLNLGFFPASLKIAVTSDGDKVYVSQLVSNFFSTLSEIKVVDAASMTLLKTITPTDGLGLRPMGMAFGTLAPKLEVDIVSITQDGGACLEVDASVSDPLNRPVSGAVSVLGVVNGPSTIESLTFTVLNTTCSNTPDVFEFFLNGTSLGTFSADPNNTCTCSAPEITYTITDPALLAAWQVGANDFRFVKTSGGSNTAIAWVNVEIGFSGSSAEACIFDKSGGNCDVSDLCSADYTFNDVDETTTVPTFSTIAQLVSVPYTNSALPDPFDISSLTVHQTFTLDITASTDDGASASDQEPFVYNGEQLLGIPACNTPPMADAGLNQTVLVGANVQLDGSGSSDTDGDLLTYSWSLFLIPGGSVSTLTDATAVNPSFSPDIAGEYIVELIVNDGTVESDPAQSTIAAQTAQEAAQDVIGQIETLLADALLNEGQGNSLITKLKSAIKKLDKEQEKVALNMLNAFINHVNSLIDEGVLTSADGDPLISAVQDIVDSLVAGLGKRTLVLNNAIPDSYTLYNNYPNPFNPETRISFALPEAGFTTIIIYDQLGREVARLVDDYLGAGYHTATWDATNVASGMYFYRLKAGDFVQTRKMVLLK